MCQAEAPGFYCLGEMQGGSNSRDCRRLVMLTSGTQALCARLQRRRLPVKGNTLRGPEGIGKIFSGALLRYRAEDCKPA
jgi:hypothetical protein